VGGISGMKKDYKLSEEAAKDQLDIFYEYYDLDVDDLPAAQNSAAKQSEKRVIRAIRLCNLEFKEEDSIKITQHLKSKDTLEYAELSGQSKIAMGKCADTDQYGKIYALCGSLTGVGAAGIQKLKGADLSLCECMGALFLFI
jgi:hypothetical protein